MKDNLLFSQEFESLKRRTLSLLFRIVGAQFLNMVRKNFHRKEEETSIGCIEQREVAIGGNYGSCYQGSEPIKFFT